MWILGSGKLWVDFSFIEFPELLHIWNTVLQFTFYSYFFQTLLNRKECFPLLTEYFSFLFFFCKKEKQFENCQIENGI